jgi:preprotein translocase subunit SecA
MLQTIDMFWVEHLEIMDYMRSSVNLRAYGQRDPLVEYKKEGLRLFKEMQYSVKSEIKRLLPNVMGGIMTNEEIKLVEIKEDAKKAQESVGGEKDIQNTGNRHARRALKKQK